MILLIAVSALWLISDERLGADCLYFPSRRWEVRLREDRLPEEVATLRALLYSGRPAPAVYEISGESSPEALRSLRLEPRGRLVWAAGYVLVGATNMTVKVEASYMGNKAQTEIDIFVLPALKQQCPRPIQEICFGGWSSEEYQVYEDSHVPVTLLQLSQPAPVCKEQGHLNYTLEKDGEGRAWMRDGRLEMSPSRQGDVELTVSCSFGKEVFRVRLKVVLIPSRVRLPILPSRPSRVVLTIAQGEERLVSWAVVGRSTPALLHKGNKSLPYSLSMERRNFTSDLLNASLLLFKLTWVKNSTLYYTKVPVKVFLCPPMTKCNRHLSDCTNTSTTCVLEQIVEVQGHQPLDPKPILSFPTERLRVIPSPFARIAQPSPAGPSALANLTWRDYLEKLEFTEALPEILESPFDVTSRHGIVYLTDWSVYALEHTLGQPGTLVEWREGGKGVGLAWLEIEVLRTGCQKWDICSEAQSEKACVRTCRIGATPLKDGRCEWRNNTSKGMTKNYATCSPDLVYCPDKFCDPLEYIGGTCAQDCTVDEVSVGERHESGQGIGRGKGVCSCSVTGSCHCGVETDDSGGAGGAKRRGRPSESREEGEMQGRQAQRGGEPAKVVETIAQAEEEPLCDMQCVAITSLAVVICIAAPISYFLIFRRCQRKEKTPMGTEYSGVHALLPIGQSAEPNWQENNASTPAVENLVHNHEVDLKWEIPRSRLKVEECLGEGEFGRVLRATARDLPNNPGILTVAVKTLKDNAGQAELEDLMSEYQLLKEVSHPNVIKLLGACTTPGAPVYIIIEYCALGSLLAYLKLQRNISTNMQLLTLQRPEEKITPRDILSFAWQISKGMSYLTEIKLVHRDLAARNILLASGKVCKISDFGLTRDVYEDDTYLKRSRGRVPVKWMALESLRDHIYTSKTDVWSFGVVLWELVTLGASPYPGIPVQDLFHKLSIGYRMQRPPNCSEYLYEIMMECWRSDPSERPAFSWLVDKFEKMLEDGADYLDCNINMVSNPAYFAAENGGPPGSGELDIHFTMDLKCNNNKEYENDRVTKNTSYDIPKPIAAIVMSDLLSKDELR